MNSQEKQQITEKIKMAAKEYGADLVGIADPARWENAPLSRSPQAMMPDCTAAIVLGIHYLDSCIELGGTPDPRYPGPSVSNHIASEHCNFAAFRLCKYIEKLGYQALMVPSTGWWNYRENPDSPRGFSGDITHYYAAVAAGLGEIGWNNLCLTPQFGPRQRLITLVTNAPVIPDPMYHGEPLCDRCKLCERKCPGQVFEKESNGPMSVKIGEREFTFQHKNLWRCACGENFQLDSFMNRPDHTNEAVVRKLCEEAAYGDPSTRFTWKMGMCLKWCVPRKRRYMDKSFAASPRRHRDVEADFSQAGVAAAHHLLLSLGKELEVSSLIIVEEQRLRDMEIDIRAILPNACSAIVVMQRFVPGGEAAVLRTAQRNALWIARRLELDLGFDTLIESGIAPERIAEQYDVNTRCYKMHIILCNIPLTNELLDLGTPNGSISFTPIKQQLREAAFARGIELFGVAPVSRLDEAANQIDQHYSNTEYFISEEQGWGLRATRAIEMKGKPKNPAIIEKPLVSKRAANYVPNAKSVIVLGVSFLNGSVKNVGKGPAPKAAHYGVTVHKEMILQNEMIANHLALTLEKYGYHAAVTSDLDGLASKSYSWMLPGIRANALTALCAGMGTLGKNGLVINRDYGSRVRYVAVVTDAELDADPLADNPDACGTCSKCITGCPAASLSDESSVQLQIEGHMYKFAVINRLRCDWASQYGLLGEEGPKYLGSTNDFQVPDHITREKLIETIKKSDRLQITNFAPIVEHCVIDCPYNDVF